MEGHSAQLGRISTAAVEGQSKICARDDAIATELVEYQRSNLDALDDLQIILLRCGKDDLREG